MYKLDVGREYHHPISLKDHLWELNIISPHGVRRTTHRSSPNSCDIRAEDLVSVFGGGHSDRTVQNHIPTYHPQKVPVGWVTQHPLSLAGCTGLLHFPMGFTRIVCKKIQPDLALDALKVDVGHAFRILAYDDVPLIRVDHKVTGVPPPES